MSTAAKLSWRGSLVGIVDDSSEWRRQVRNMFFSFGAKDVVEARDGSEMLHLAQTYGRPLDLIMVDDEMDPLDGFMAMRTLRSTPGLPGRRATAILMPGHGSVDILKRALDVGYHSILPKPFSASQLGQHLLRVLTRPMQWTDEGGMLRPVISQGGD
ncbi:MAG TPA: response regulator [Candidatus Sulfotelmatobacter sp.]|jgi:CheY-like chemotaxis protein|nr:response regulator [Candidatus Sulfotelmatobacter sp.]